MAQKGLKSFAARMRKYGNNVVTGSARIQRQAALAIDSAVVIATPVDTGRARSNWQVSNGGPAVGTREAYVPGDKGSTGAQNTQAAIQQGQQTVAQHQQGQSIHITNNLDYIGKLNDGSSAQAPAGFVERAVIVGIDAIAKSKSILEG